MTKRPTKKSVVVRTVAALALVTALLSAGGAGFGKNGVTDAFDEILNVISQ